MEQVRRELLEFRIIKLKHRGGKRTIRIQNHKTETYRLESFDREPIENGRFPVRLLKDTSL
jgi:hypothetical protein